MKIFKRILLGIGLLIALALITGLFMDKEYSLEREVTINKPKDHVFGYVKSLKNQNNYSVWALMEPDMRTSFRGADGQVGFVSAWEGDQVGKGEQEIKAIREGEGIDCELRFEEPFASVAQTRMTTEALSADQTKVRWRFAAHTSYPFNVLSGLMKWSLGNNFQDGLYNLKDILEKGRIAEKR